MGSLVRQSSGENSKIGTNRTAGGGVSTPPRQHGALTPPRITRRVFTDLALWMLGLGVAIGIVFPFVLIPLGVPRQHAMRAEFFASTVLAGILLAAASYLLAHWVVGVRLAALSDRMRHVGEVIAEATYSGDWAQCSPQSCQLTVDSADALGEVAASFNDLLTALESSREVEAATRLHIATLTEHLDLIHFGQCTLQSLLGVVGAQAGALLVTREGELEVCATHHLDTFGLADNPSLAAALARAEPDWLAVPASVAVDGTLLAFRPAAVAVLPVMFRATPVGAVVAAFAEPPAPDTRRLMATLLAPTGVALNNVLAHERFQRLAALDPLTGAYNRRFGLGRLAEEWARAVRASAPLGVLAFDLDHFKLVNDTYGHLVGDRVLRDAAAAARLVLREGDVLVRTGGEEFLVVLPAAGHNDVRAVAERIRRAVAANAFSVGDNRVTVTISLGGAAMPDCGAQSSEDLLALVDQALYAAKDGGRDRVTMSPAALARTS